MLYYSLSSHIQPEWDSLNPYAKPYRENSDIYQEYSFA